MHKEHINTMSTISWKKVAAALSPLINTCGTLIPSISLGYIQPDSKYLLKV